MTTIQEKIKEFEKEFVAIGADIEGMKRVEYRQLREHQVDQAVSFFTTALTEARQEGRDEVVDYFNQTIIDLREPSGEIKDMDWSEVLEKARNLK